MGGQSRAKPLQVKSEGKRKLKPFYTLGLKIKSERPLFIIARGLDSFSARTRRHSSGTAGVKQSAPAQNKSTKVHVYILYNSLCVSVIIKMPIIRDHVASH